MALVSTHPDSSRGLCCNCRLPVCLVNLQFWPALSLSLCKAFAEHFQNLPENILDNIWKILQLSLPPGLQSVQMAVESYHHLCTARQEDDHKESAASNGGVSN